MAFLRWHGHSSRLEFEVSPRCLKKLVACETKVVAERMREHLEQVYLSASAPLASELDVCVKPQIAESMKLAVLWITAPVRGSCAHRALSSRNQ